uniref:N-acetyltransferase domain-containing protein n=1 Tax=Macrostomum lignano TaxID=282301 RepID=A0A1I8JIA9_9PLAT
LKSNFQLRSPMETQDSTARAADLPRQVQLRPGRPAEDAEFVALCVRDLAVSHEGMLPFCHMGASDHFRVLQSGLARLLVAEAAGRPAGFALYTRCHLDRQPRPGLYLQAVYVCEDYRGLKVGKSLLVALARQALATGCDHIKLIVHTDNEALSWYQRIGFQVLTETEGVAFFEMNDVDFVAGLVAAAEQPLPDGASLRLRPCDGADGRRFELRTSGCDCRLFGASELSYCMWEGEAVQLAAADKPTLPSPHIVWVDTVANRPTSGGLDDLLMRAGFENNTANEGWLICLLAGRPLHLLANRPLNCRLHPELAGCPDS